MNKSIMATASALAVLAAVPALAQSNGSSVTQTGNDNQATVEQTGSGASSAVTQSSNDNRARVRAKSPK